MRATTTRHNWSRIACDWIGILVTIVGLRGERSLTISTDASFTSFLYNRYVSSRVRVRGLLDGNVVVDALA